MQYMILAYDAKDNSTYERRLENREQHLANAKKRMEDKQLLFISALLDEEEKMIGSLMVVEYESKEKLLNEWIENDPYYVNNVWQEIKITQVKIPQL